MNTESQKTQAGLSSNLNGGASKHLVVHLVFFSKSDNKILNEGHFKIFAVVYILCKMKVIIQNHLGTPCTTQTCILYG